MPRTTRDGRTIRYATEGSGPTVAFVGEAGLGAWLWSALQPGLAGQFETIVWDAPGVGESDPGPVSVGTLRADLEAVRRASGADRLHLVGCGLGGLVALETARRADRIASVIALGTVEEPALEGLWAPPDDPDALEAATRAHLASRPPDEWLDRIVEWRAGDDADRECWEAHRAAHRAATLADPYEITTPALLAGATEDTVAPVAETAALAAEFPRGEHREFAGGHLFALSRGRALIDVCTAWLADHSDASDDPRSGEF